MLYLMSFRNDSDEIYYFIVDFFNDLTGMDKMSQRLWDLQSKGASNSSPKAIGKELVTLFKNYISEFDFHHYILFLGGVTGSLRENHAKTVFDITNIKASALKNIKIGLTEECKEKTYINNAKVTTENIDKFLKNVIFVVDDKKPSEYVKSIIGGHLNIIPEDSVLTAIFNEIRDKQASKKNIGSVEGITIQTTDEALIYCRHLTSSEIKLMVLGRIINRNPFDKGVPYSFMSIFIKFPPEKQKDVLEDCQLSLSRAFFDKNGADNFWGLFENVHFTITSYPHDDVNEVFNKIDRDIANRCPCFEVLSLKYFIAIVKDGVQA